MCAFSGPDVLWCFRRALVPLLFVHLKTCRLGNEMSCEEYLKSVAFGFLTSNFVLICAEVVN